MAKMTKAFAIFVLIGVSAFFAVTYYKTFMTTEAETAEGPNTVLVKEKEPQGSAPETSEEKKVEVLPVSVYRSSLPRAAKSLNDGYINNVGGYGKESLCASYRLGNATYAVLSSKSDNCDLNCLNSNLAIARYDGNGTLTDALTLTSSYDEFFLSASLYDDGFMIAASNGGGVSVYAVSLEMKISRLTLNVKASAALSYYTSSGVIIALFGGNYIYVYLLSSQLNVIREMSFSNQGTSSPISMYQSGDMYLLANAASSAKVFRFTLDGVKDVSELPYVDDVLPVKDGFMISSCASKKIYVYDHTFSSKKEYDLPSTAENVKAYGCTNGYFLLCYGANKQTISYYLCRHFDQVSFNATDYDGIERIYDVVEKGGCLYFAAENRNGISLYKYDVNSHFAEKLFQIKGASVAELYLYEDGVILLYESEECIGEHSGNFGSTDVWIRCIER